VARSRGATPNAFPAYTETRWNAKSGKDMALKNLDRVWSIL